MRNKFNLAVAPFELDKEFDGMLEEFDTERADPEWQSEVTRGSREHIRWVQSSLNQIMGLRLVVDGVMGSQTRSAIRNFQQRSGLAPDGIVGARTQDAIQAALRTSRPQTTSGVSTSSVPPNLTLTEQAEFNRLSATAQNQFRQLRTIIAAYTGVARAESDRGSRTLLRYGYFRQHSQLLPEILRLTQINTLPNGWRLEIARPLLVGNVLYNLAFPETINQGGTDRLGGTADPTCFSASTQILVARRYPVTFVRLTIQLATTNRATFTGGDSIGPLTFASTSLYKSLDSVLLQTAFDRYFKTKARYGMYKPGDELKVHWQVFGLDRPPRFATYGTKASMISAFRRAFVTGGGNTRRWEIINLCVGNPSPSCLGNHSVVLTRIAGGRVYFYNPWADEEEKNMMWGSAQVSVSGHGERPAESSMTQANFENQLTTVFHN